MQIKRINFNFLENIWFILGVYALTVLTISIQSYFLGLRTAPDGGLSTHYNNYLIFKQSFFHLIQNKDLYLVYRNEYYDLFKYSPTFALLMAPLAVLPDFFGLFLWNLLNTFILIFAIQKLPNYTEKYKNYILWIVLIELITSLQNGQSNGLLAGLLIFSFISLENNNYSLAALFIALSVFIKLFGIVALAFFLIYPKKVKFIAFSVIWFMFLLLLPLIAVPLEYLINLYVQWLHLLINDHSISSGLSLLGVLESFGIPTNKNLILLFGIVLFLIPFLFIKKYKHYSFRVLILASILIWVVIFNHKAESPTFIIAMTGVAIWFYALKRNKINVMLLVLAFIFTSVSVTDIFPNFIQDGFFDPYRIKAIPCILIWFKIIYDLIFYKIETSNLNYA